APVTIGAGWSEMQPSERAASAPAVQTGWGDARIDATLPAVLGIDHLDYRLDEPEFAAQTLKFLERAMYRDDAKVVRIASDRDALACLRDSGTPAGELERWVRTLRSFRKEIIGIGGRAGEFEIDTSHRVVETS